MLNYAKKLIFSLNWMKDKSDKILEEEREIINTIKNTDAELEEINDVEDEERLLGESESPEILVKKFQCVHKSGKITHLCEEYGLIDEIIHFVPKQVSPNISIKLNDEVFYIAYRCSDNECERLYKIYALKKDSWDHDEECPEVDENFSKTDELISIVRHIPGRVTTRRGRDMFIDTIDTWCSLDNIEISFIPIEGDWVYVEAAVSLDENVPNFIGDLIEVKSVKPLIKKSSFGRITLWSMIKKEGAIENSIFFTKVECESGYKPSLGDQVVYDAIESDQGSYKWRALIVYPYEKKLRENYESTSDVSLSAADTPNVFCNKNGITITPNICGVEVELNSSKVVRFKIINNGQFEKLLKSVSLIPIKNSQLSRPKLSNKLENCLIKPNETVDVFWTCKGRFLGLSGEICLFRFKEFVLARKIEINVLSSKEMDALLECKTDQEKKAFENSVPNKYHNLEKPDLVLYGSRPWQPPKFILRERKCIFKLPPKLKEIMENNLKGMNKLKAVEEYAPYLKFDLNFAHYVDRFHTLLFLEEIEISMNFRKYNMDRVCLNRYGEYLSLEVPDLMERRPSILIGDSVVLTQPWLNQDKIQHVGFIHETVGKMILIKFHRSFHDSYDESMCNIRFLPNTYFFMRCHEALSRAEKILGEKWLFPSSVNEKPPQIDINFINFDEDVFKVETQSKVSENPKDKHSKKNSKDDHEKLKKEKNKKATQCTFINNNLNYRQKLAVVNVLKGQGRPLPYIIFGPPGTGKTVTLVEIIIQIYLLIPESRILVTTPSNSAADLICKRIIEMIDIKPGQLVRLVALTRVLEGLVPVNLRPYTAFFKHSETFLGKYKNNENIMSCSENELNGKHRITISTCTSTGKLHFCGYSTGHFTHILIDEASQTVEPEVLISATFQNIETGQVVLVGDPMQLGPFICSPIAKKYGFGESLLERFTKTFPYTKDLKSFPDTSGYDPRFITRLNVNYRTVPEILSITSQMFYDSDLIPAVSQTDSEEASIIRKFNFKTEGREEPAAIIFHGIIGKNYQEVDNPSWFNPHEIWQVVLYLQKLYSVGLTSSDVGIVTPYSKQVQKLTTLIVSLKLAVPKIASVEEFQGQENKVIILSSVRSSLKLLQTDVIHNLGFVACPKRLNVSLTRAKALLIIVGNPILLSKDPYWVNVIKYCIKNKSYTGCNLNYFENNLKMTLEVEEEEDPKKKKI